MALALFSPRRYQPMNPPARLSTPTQVHNRSRDLIIGSNLPSLFTSKLGSARLQLAKLQSSMASSFPLQKLAPELQMSRESPFKSLIEFGELTITTGL